MVLKYVAIGLGVAGMAMLVWAAIVAAKDRLALIKEIRSRKRTIDLE